MSDGQVYCTKCHRKLEPKYSCPNCDDASSILREALERIAVGDAMWGAARIAREALLRAGKRTHTPIGNGVWTGTPEPAPEPEGIVTASEATLDDSAQRREPDHSADAGKMVAPEPEVRSCASCGNRYLTMGAKCGRHWKLCENFSEWTPAASGEGEK